MFSILILPEGTFTGANVNTIVLFFEKGKKTKNIWLYELSLDRNLGKSKPLTLKDLEEFNNYALEKKISSKSWVLDNSKLNDLFTISIVNPNKKIKEDSRTVKEIIEEIEKLNKDSEASLNEIKKLL